MLDSTSSVKEASLCFCKIGELNKHTDMFKDTFNEAQFYFGIIAAFIKLENPQLSLGLGKGGGAFKR